MRRGLVLLALMTCVPAGHDDDPRGGVLATFAPSDATTGKAITTPDGWTLTIDRFAILGQISVDHVVLDSTGQPAYGGGGTGAAAFLVPGPTCTVDSRAIPVGDATVSSLLPNNFVTDAPKERTCDVAPDLLARFLAEADNDPFYDSYSPVGPNLIVVAHAIKDGRRLDFDFALAADIPSHVPAQAVVGANAAVSVALPVNAEKLFIPSDEFGVTLTVEPTGIVDDPSDAGDL